MANKLSLKEVFLVKENEMSRRYGLDMDTPKGVYVPDVTRNKVIAHTAEEPLEEEGDMQHECGCGAAQGPHIHRVGAPGGPDLGGGGENMMHAPMGGEADMGAAIIMVGETDPYHNEAAPGANPDPEAVVLHDHGPNDEDALDPADEDYYYYYDRKAGHTDDEHASDWKPRHESIELDKRKDSEDMQFE